MSEALSYDAFDQEPSAEPMPEMPIGEAFVARALEFAVNLKKENIKPIEYTDPRTGETSSYWIIHRRKHYDGKTNLASNRRSGRATYNLRQVIVVHEDGQLDIATSPDVHFSDKAKQYAPHRIQNIGKALHLDELGQDAQQNAWETFINDLSKPPESYAPRES